MHWYLVHTKPRQEKRALENLQRQGYQCYLPTLPAEKVKQKLVAISVEPLFPRYLFIRLGQENTSKSWLPIRSTIGVSRLVSFGSEPAKVDDKLIDLLQAHAETRQRPAQLFETGERVCLTEGPFAGIEGIYQMSDGERRVMVLIEMMSKPVMIKVAPTDLRRA